MLGGPMYALERGLKQNGWAFYSASLQPWQHSVSEVRYKLTLLPY